jgi:hypothetical protein
VTFWPHRARAESTCRGEPPQSQAAAELASHDKESEKDEMLRPWVDCFRSSLDLDGESRETPIGTAACALYCGIWNVTASHFLYLSQRNLYGTKLLA